MVYDKGKQLTDRGGRMLGIEARARVRAGRRVAARAPAPRAAQEPQDLIVQSTTSVRDSGLLEQVIMPEFQRQYPQWRLKVVAVGHRPGDHQRARRPGRRADHPRAGARGAVRRRRLLARAGRAHDHVERLRDRRAARRPGRRRCRRRATTPRRAFEAIAAAGAAGRATFVSRGDNSGTNTKESEIWGLTSVARNARNEPAGGGTANPAWYTKAGLGMADTLRLTQQCPSAAAATRSPTAARCSS